LGSRGLEVADGLAAELSLTCPPAPWHAHRDQLGDLVCASGLYTATIGKIARDVSLLMQFEVGEVAEPGGGSSTMPHKRNPSACAIALAAASRLPGLVSSFLTGMVQEHERGLGGLHAEWPVIADAMQATGAATLAMAAAIEGLTVDAARMRANVEATHGVVFAERAMMQLGPALGRDRAHELVSRAAEAAIRNGTSLSDGLGAMPEVAAAMSAKDMASLDQPEEYLGAAEAMRKALLG
jgi:3-carboxy-cis,cis-muconate cycloisomerase